MLLDAGADCFCVAYERDFHKGRVPSIPVEYIGKLINDRYISRIPALLLSIPRLRKALKNVDIVYTFSVDLAVISMIASIGLKRKVRLLEVGDIRHLQTRSGMIGRTYRIFDRWLSNRQNLIVVTAEDFLNVYYKNWLSCNTKGLVLENKLEKNHADSALASSFQHASQQHSDNTRLTIGYFGLLQSKWSWRVLQKLALDHPERFRVVLAGYPIKLQDVELISTQHENIDFIGEYKSPEDLPKLYSQVDLVWGCYSPFGPNDWNLQWARPNRFYEACAFKTPLISRDTSTDGKYVEKLKIGFVVDDTDSTAAAVRLSKIEASDVATWRKNMNRLDPALYTYTDESEQLKREIAIALEPGRQ